jgi:hypothetical protein
MKIIHDIKSALRQPGESLKFHLLISLSENLLVLSTFDPIEKKFFSLKSFALESTDFNSEYLITDKIEETSLIFKKRIIGYSCPNFTLVPGIFMETNDLAEKYYQINFNTEGDEVIKTSYFEKFKTNFIYGIPIKNSNFIENLKPDLMTFPIGNYLEMIIQDSTNKEQNNVFIDIDGSFLTVIVFQQSSLQLCNSYKYKVPEDILYHTLNIIKHFNFDPDKDKFYFSGLVDRNSPIYTLLYKYLRFPVLMPRPQIFNFDSCFDDLPSHIYLKNFALGLCE